MSALNLTATTDKNGKLIHRWMKSEREQQLAALVARDKGLTTVMSSTSGGPRTTVSVDGHTLFDGPLERAHEQLRPGAYTAEFEGEDLTLLVAENSSTAIEDATPVEVDEAVAFKDGQYYEAYLEHKRARDQLRYHTGDRSMRGQLSYDQTRELVEKRIANPDTAPWDRDSAQNALDRVDETHAAMELAQEERKPMDEEFRNRGGWSRAYLAMTNSNNGHVHSNQHCSSLHRGEYMTRLNWMTDYSGKSEEEIVGDAGERACTICYSSAPTLNSALKNKTKMFSKEEIQAEKDREQRKIEAAERARVKDAKSIATPVFDAEGNVAEMKPLKDENGYEVKTVVSATNEAVSAMFDIKAHAAWGWSGNPEGDARRADFFERAVDALSYKGFVPKKGAEAIYDRDQVRAAMIDKVNAKLKKEKIMDPVTNKLVQW